MDTATLRTLITEAVAEAVAGLRADLATRPPEPQDADALLLTPAEAAKLLAISERSLWDLQASGEIRVIRLGKSVRYPRSELEKFIASRLAD